MKKSFTILTALVLVAALAPVATAQTVHDQIALSRAEIQADRQTIVAATLGLTEAESQVFWPMYREYRAEMDVPNDRLWNLFLQYGERWQVMSNDDATKALDEFLSTEKQQVEIRLKWAKKMNGKLSGVSVARFFQIDNKLDSVIRMEAAAEIPLIVRK